MSIDALSTQAGLPTRQVRQVRAPAAAIEPQRPDLAAADGESRQPRAGIARPSLPNPVPAPSIRVEYLQNRPILMLHDRSGVLVYQMPSKGTLQLIRQEDARSWSLSERV